MLVGTGCFVISRRRKLFGHSSLHLPMYGGVATPWHEVVTPKAAFQPIGAASLAASYVSLYNPTTWDAAPVVAPTFDAATGWEFDGATTYLLLAGGAIVTAAPLTMIALVNLDVNTFQEHMGVSRDNTQNNRFTMRTVSSGADCLLQTWSYAGATNGSAQASTTHAVSTWVVLASKYSAANSRAALINGGNEGTGATSVTPASVNITTIGCSHNGSNYIAFTNGKVGACGFWDSAVSNADILTIANKLLALVA